MLLRSQTTHRSLSLKQDYPSGIKVTSTVTTKTVKPPPTSPKREQNKPGPAPDLAVLGTDLKAMMHAEYDQLLLD